MPHRWKHPELGTFALSGGDWKGVVDLPAFHAFAFDTGYDNAPRSSGTYEISFSGPDVPSTEMVRVVYTLQANQQQVVAEINGLLWDSLSGAGHYIAIGNMRAITETLARDGISAPNSAEGILGLMQLYSVSVLRTEFEPSELIIELDFHAALEPEHGIGVLTDGRRVLGIGYACDVAPLDFKPTKARFGPGANSATRGVPKRASLWGRLSAGR